MSRNTTVLQKSDLRLLVSASDYDLERISDEIEVHDTAEEVAIYVSDDPHIDIISRWSASDSKNGVEGRQ